MFEGNKLNIIYTAVSKVKNQGELAVYNRIVRMEAQLGYETIFTEAEMNIIKYCAEECKRQRSGEMSVYWMVDAWAFAQRMHGEDKPEIQLTFIQALGKSVEPHKNAYGIRHRPGDRVGISNGFEWIEKTPPDRVIPNLELLIEQYYAGVWSGEKDTYSLIKNWHNLAESSEDMFYYEYENIHPFMDGNGRTGKIIYNYLKGTLDNPVMPPNFWGGSNP